MARPSSDIDPRRVDALQQPKRRRKNRKLPDPSPNLKADEQATIDKLMSLPMNPGIMAEKDGDSWVATAPHSDRSLWEAQIAAAFGTRSTALVRSFVSQLKRLCPDEWDADLQAWKTNETEWNALLGMIADHRPENATQAALAAQMASVHLMQIRLAAQALNNGHMIMERDAALASKLARTFAMQCETMQALKGKKKTTKQSIKVTKTLKQEVHYHDHRQGGGVETDGRPQEARASTIEGRAKVSGESQEHGQVVPFSSGSRETGLPQARRGKSGREKG